MESRFHATTVFLVCLFTAGLGFIFGAVVFSGPADGSVHSEIASARSYSEPQAIRASAFENVEEAQSSGDDAGPVSLKRSRQILSNVSEGRIRVLRVAPGPRHSNLTAALVRSGKTRSLVWLTDSPDHPYAIVGRIYDGRGNALSVDYFRYLAHSKHTDRRARVVADELPFAVPPATSASSASPPSPPSSPRRATEATPAEHLPPVQPGQGQQGHAHQPGQPAIRKSGYTVLPNSMVLPALKAAHGFLWSSQKASRSSAKLVMFFDPNCIFCHQEFRTLKPMVTAGQVRVWLVPVGFLKPSSMGRAEAILESRSPIKAFVRNESGFNVNTESGAIPPAETNSASGQMVKANTKILARIDGGRYLETPTLLVRRRSGTAGGWDRCTGYMAAPALARFLGQEKVSLHG